jgi:hypothetical protein
MGYQAVGVQKKNKCQKIGKIGCELVEKAEIFQ